MKRLSVAAALVAWTTPAAAQLVSSGATLPAIAPESLRAHVVALADDSMEGRATGTRGYARASAYVAAHFAAAGLTPPANGDWFQQVPLRRRDLVNEGTSLTLIGPGGSRHTYVVGDDFVLTRPGSETADLEAPVVFVGYGLTIPGRLQDDYAGMNVRGKIVAFLPGTPTGLTLDERTFYGGTKLRNAIAHGALATLRLWTPEEAKTEAWRSAVDSYTAAGIFTWATDSVPPSATRPMPEHLWLGAAASAELFSGSPTSYASAMANPTPALLPARAHISAQGRITVAQSPNVVGLLPGSDSVLRDEYVAVTAHLDHLGIGRAIQGDSIYNGAVDNASGIAALLELARVFTMMPDRPRRSLLFVAFTGEEPGNLGSEYFVGHAPVPIASVVANVNIDGVSLWPFDGLVPRGAEHSSLSRSVESALAEAGMKVAPDPTPGRASLAGSDQYSFMTEGVPAVIFGAARSGSSRELAIAWARDRYHAPSDDLSRPMDFGAAAQFTRALFAVARAIAQDGERPRWNRQDFFERFRTTAPATRPR